MIDGIIALFGFAYVLYWHAQHEFNAEPEEQPEWVKQIERDAKAAARRGRDQTCFYA